MALHGFLPFNEASGLVRNVLAPYQQLQHVLAPACLSRCLERLAAGTWNIDLLIEHDAKQKLASSAAGTLKVWQDAEGIHFRTTEAVDMAIRAALAKRGGRLWRGVSAELIPEPDFVKYAGEVSQGVPLYVYGSIFVTEFTLTDTPAARFTRLTAE